MNFGSPNLTKPKKKVWKHNKMLQHFHNTFYFQLWLNPGLIFYYLCL